MMQILGIIRKKLRIMEINCAKNIDFLVVLVYFVFKAYYRQGCAYGNQL